MVVSVNNLSKLYKNKPLSFRNGGLFAVGKNVNYALKDVSFDVKKGECVGIIGLNGSGKSTLLKILCGVTSPTSGEIYTNGKISALLELGTGFNPEYNGISNIYLNGNIHGLSRKEIKCKISEICEFAELGDYIYKPVKTYSDGMFLRLAFSCATAFTPDILIIDEALAVGDFTFRQKCFSKIRELNNSGVTILTVSHDIDVIRRLCTRAIWLENGKIKADGDIKKISSMYMESVTDGTDYLLKNKKRFGSHTGTIKNINAPKVMNTNGNYEIICNLHIPDDIDTNLSALSVSFKDACGLDLCVISTYDKGFNFIKHGDITVKFDFICNLCPGKYSMCVSFENRDTNPIKYYDYAEYTEIIEVISNNEYFGVFTTDFDITEG